MEQLTKQQDRIVKLLAEGYDTFEIADELKISYRTVKQHISMMIKKLEVRNRTEIVAMYYEGEIKQLKEELRKVKEGN